MDQSLEHHPARSPPLPDAPAPATPARPRQLRKQLYFTHRHLGVSKLTQAKFVATRAAKRAQKIRKFREPCTVFVGNIGPDVDEGALAAHFKSCGKILSAKLHCCGGVAMTTKPPRESRRENTSTRQYAVVVFESTLARQRACTQENVLGGRKLTVAVAMSDLPEVREKITKRLDDYQSRMEPPDPFRARKSALKSLGLESTELLDPRQDMEGKTRHQIWGHSFSEGVM